MSRIRRPHKVHDPYKNTSERRSKLGCHREAITGQYSVQLGKEWRNYAPKVLEDVDNNQKRRWGRADAIKPHRNGPDPFTSITGAPSTTRMEMNARTQMVSEARTNRRRRPSYHFSQSMVLRNDSCHRHFAHSHVRRVKCREGNGNVIISGRRGRNIAHWSIWRKEKWTAVKIVWNDQSNVFMLISV